MTAFIQAMHHSNIYQVGGIKETQIIILEMVVRLLLLPG
jgi:hypothetical protein